MDGQVAPGATIGILGSGQLGRMLAMAGARLGVKCHVFAPDRGPAGDVAAAYTQAPYEDETALEQFAQTVSLVTYEFENVPAQPAKTIARFCPVLPDPLALSTTQDRLHEKTFLNGLGIETAPWAPVDDAGNLARAVAQLGRPSILKTRRFGYDGKGQAMIREGSDLAAVFRSLGAQPCVLEAVVPFIREISVVAARSADGSFAAWDVCENEHANHVLAATRVPARMADITQRQAIEIVRKVVDGLNYTGVIAVEMFLVEGADGGEKVLVNEIAPRVHNSGHWTIDGSVTSQFEQHIRAICGWPLGSTSRHGRIEMMNLLGEDAMRWREFLGEAGAALHLYGKHEARPGRKMGHLTRVFPE